MLSKQFSTAQTSKTSDGEQKTNDVRYAHAKIYEVKDLTSDIKLVSLMVSPGSSIQFMAGQFIGVYDGRSNVQPSIFPGTYSIASRPSELPLIRFAIGMDQNPRNLRHHLYFNAQIGDPILLDESASGTVAILPQMLMTPIGGPGGLMLIGGGSAVMGLVSIVEELLFQKDAHKLPFIKLFHSNRSNDDIPFYDRMKELEQENPNFHYRPHITGRADTGNPRGIMGRITMEHLAAEIAGTRLFCVCGSGVFCEAIVNMLLHLGVWPGSIRTDYTTRVDPARRLHLLSENQSTSNATATTRFEACADATQSKGTMVSSGNDYLQTYGIDALLNQICSRLVEDKPEFPLEYLKNNIEAAQSRLPEVNNIKAADPNFWINYWETDTVTWQAPVVSPWLVKYLGDLVGTKKSKFPLCTGGSRVKKGKRIFVPLCGKSLDMKLLLDAGHHVIGSDCSGIACSDFFTENRIADYVQEVVEHPEGKRIIRHKSLSLPIDLYEGDIFDLTAESLGGPVDCILDRAALVALHPSLIESQYLPLMMRLLRPGGKILFASVSELPFPKAPPHAYKKEQIENLLHPFFSKIKLLETHRYRVNAGYVSEPIYLLTAKK